MILPYRDWFSPFHVHAPAELWIKTITTMNFLISIKMNSVHKYVAPVDFGMECAFKKNLIVQMMVES
jgi:hypothetical protein